MDVNGTKRKCSRRVDGSLDLIVDPELQEQLDRFRKRVENEQKLRDGSSVYSRRLNDRFCEVCFFGKVEGVCEGMHLCKDCMDHMYEFGVDQFNTALVRRRTEYRWYIMEQRQRVYEAFYNLIAHKNL